MILLLATALGLLCLGWLALYGRLVAILLRLPRLADAPGDLAGGVPESSASSELASGPAAAARVSIIPYHRSCFTVQYR